jgi:hypothetical protein
MTKNTNQHRYGIGAVAKLTGLTDHTIRVWERRYSAVVADRAANGRREYSAADVEKLGLLKLLTDQGIAISQIAGNSVAALRERAASLGDFVAPKMPDAIGVAILGDFLPALLRSYPRNPAPVDVRVADSNRDRFAADLERQPVDVVVVESAILDANAIQALRHCMQIAGIERGVLVYSFGRGRDVEQARDARIAVLRAPVGADELLAAIIRAFRAPVPASPRPRGTTSDTGMAAWNFAGPVAPRRFNQQQLARLAGVSSSVDCECPQHLAQLVGDLSAFEIYSANCANRDDDDAALHRYLHRTTAQARALVEEALEKVALAEGIEF